MPQIGRRSILANLQSSLAALPQQDPESVLKSALQAAGLKDKPFFTPEETALIARALMAQAADQGQAALEGWTGPAPAQKAGT